MEIALAAVRIAHQTPKGWGLLFRLAAPRSHHNEAMGPALRSHPDSLVWTPVGTFAKVARSNAERASFAAVPALTRALAAIGQGFTVLAERSGPVSDAGSPVG